MTTPPMRGHTRMTEHHPHDHAALPDRAPVFTTGPADFLGGGVIPPDGPDGPEERPFALLGVLLNPAGSVRIPRTTEPNVTESAQIFTRENLDLPALPAVLLMDLEDMAALGNALIMAAESIRYLDVTPPDKRTASGMFAYATDRVAMHTEYNDMLAEGDA